MSIASLLCVTCTTDPVAAEAGPVATVSVPASSGPATVANPIHFIDPSGQ